MPNNVSFFIVAADDLARAREFYEQVFGWKFEAWGPPGFFLIKTGTDKDPGIGGALQKRHEPLTGEGNRAYECTISVDDVDATAAAVVKNGGKIIMPKAVIPTVGWLIRFQDTEGNVAGAMRYDAGAK
jgi:predicted enzyme related to lactoylglutathione lyase